MTASTDNASGERPFTTGVPPHLEEFVERLRKNRPSTGHVVFGRTESIPGEFANVHVEVQVELEPGEDHAAALARASRLVRERIREELRKRRDLSLTTLDSFAGDQDQEANA